MQKTVEQTGVDPSERAFVVAFEFGDFRADPARNALTCVSTGEASRLPPRTMDALSLLARHAGQVVSRQSFADAVWPGRRVVDDSLSLCISELRKALDDSPREPRYIRTVPKRGYCLLPEVTWDEVPLHPAPNRDIGSDALSLGKRSMRGMALVVTLSGVVLAASSFLDDGARDRSVPTPGEPMSMLSPIAGNTGSPGGTDTQPETTQQLYKRARYHLDRRTEADLPVARELFERILSRDPEFVEAILGVAELQREMARHDHRESASVGYRAAYSALIERAQQVAPEHPAVMAMTYRPGTGVVDWQQYEDDLRRLVSRAPDCVACVCRLSEFYLEVGWFQDALDVWQGHRRYWPLSVSMHAALAQLQARLGSAAGALRQVELIRALVGDDAWDVRAAEANAYLILGDVDPWLAHMRTLLGELGESGQQRLAIYEAMLAGDEARLDELARSSPVTRDFNIALTLGLIDPLVERVRGSVARGEYRDLQLVHGWIHERNTLTRRYIDGLARLQQDPRIQTLFADMGLSAFWRKRGKYPDYCSRVPETVPYCA